MQLSFEAQHSSTFEFEHHNLLKPIRSKFLLSLQKKLP